METTKKKMENVKTKSVGTQTLINPLSEEKLKTKRLPPSLNPSWKMTSREFHFDLRCATNSIRHNLKDYTTMQSFRNVIITNRHMFKGKIVLVLQCSVGLLALEAARAGAAKVYAVDTSNVVCYARTLVAKHGYSDVIKVLKGPVEEIKLPKEEKVDIILCNWAGYSILCGSFYADVLYAREKWLNLETGIIFPDQATLHVALFSDCECRNNHINWWNSVYDFKMSCIGKAVNRRPVIKSFQTDNVISSYQDILHVNLNDPNTNLDNFKNYFVVTANQTINADGLMTFFDLHFTKAHVPVKLSTYPWMRPTNWHQNGFFFDKQVRVKKGKEYFGGIQMIKDPNTGNIAIHNELFTNSPEPLTFLTQMTWLYEQDEATIDTLE